MNQYMQNASNSAGYIKMTVNPSRLTVINKFPFLCNTEPGLGILFHTPSRSDSWVRHESTISGMPSVSSGELISGCDPPGRCQLSKIPTRHGWQLGACSQFGGGCRSPRPRSQQLLAFWPWMPLACLSASDGGQKGPVCSQLALLWYSLNPLFCE